MNVRITKWSDQNACLFEANVPDDAKHPICIALEKAVAGGANLRGANLLCDADLCGADLGDANLRGANLRGAKDSGRGALVLPGVQFSEFVEEVVPELLIGGGKKLEEVANERTWLCHEWSNCPLHEAYGAKSTADIPARWRPFVYVFVALYDSGAIPIELVLKTTKASQP